jgi:hypothetical protein
LDGWPLLDCQAAGAGTRGPRRRSARRQQARTGICTPPKTLARLHASSLGPPTAAAEPLAGRRFVPSTRPLLRWLRLTVLASPQAAAASLLSRRQTGPTAMSSPGTQTHLARPGRNTLLGGGVKIRPTHAPRSCGTACVACQTASDADVFRGLCHLSLGSGRPWGVPDARPVPSLGRGGGTEEGGRGGMATAGDSGAMQSTHAKGVPQGWHCPR